MTGRTAAAILWASALMTALLWPSHTLSLFHGMPLDGHLLACDWHLECPLLGHDLGANPYGPGLHGPFASDEFFFA